MPEAPDKARSRKRKAAAVATVHGADATKKRGSSSAARSGSAHDAAAARAV
jgi:hypothetical protein